MGGLDLTRAGIRSRTGAARKKTAGRERDRIGLRYDPSAREWFAELSARLLASRSVLGATRSGSPIYGPPAFRNRIDADGRHV